jgi:hypothetical protein
MKTTTNTIKFLSLLLITLLQFRSPSAGRQVAFSEGELRSLRLGASIQVRPDLLFGVV